jgi:hypothetical protein
LVVASEIECQLQNSTRNPVFASGPMILTFAKVAVERGCDVRIGPLDDTLSPSTPVPPI